MVRLRSVSESALLSACFSCLCLGGGGRGIKATGAEDELALVQGAVRGGHGSGTAIKSRSLDTDDEAACARFRSSVRDALDPDPQLLQMPDTMPPSTLPVIATYAGRDKPVYVDGAVMLGLALQRFVPEFPRVCLVIKGMLPAWKAKLESAGWNVIEVPDIVPQSHSNFKAKGFEYWIGSYAKINIFRLPFETVLYLDADTYIFNAQLRNGLLLNASATVPKDHVGMVQDVIRGQGKNSGAMLFHPRLSFFVDAVDLMSRECPGGRPDWNLDQPVINRLFRKRFVLLDRRFNLHGRKRKNGACKTVAVAHFTGEIKPAIADWEVLDTKIRTGTYVSKDVCALGCPELYMAYFCDMKTNVGYLTNELQLALNKTGDCQEPPWRPTDDKLVQQGASDVRDGPAEAREATDPDVDDA